VTTFSVSVQLANPRGGPFVDVEAVVDTGSTFTAAARELLERASAFASPTGELSKTTWAKC